MSSSRESLSALHRRIAEVEVRRSEKGRGALGMSRRHLNNPSRNAVDLRMPKHFQAPRHVDFLLIQISSSSCSVIAHHDPPS